MHALLKYNPLLLVEDISGLTPRMLAEQKNQFVAAYILKKAEESAEKKQLSEESKPMEMNQTEKMIAFVQALRLSKQKETSSLQPPVFENQGKSDTVEQRSEESSRTSKDSVSSGNQSADNKS